MDGKTDVSDYGFDMSHEASIGNNLINHVRFLEGHPDLKGKFRYNEWAMRNEVVLPLPWDSGNDPRPFRDGDIPQLMLEAECLGLPARRDKMQDAVSVVCQKSRYNPAQGLLMKLPPCEKPCLGTILSTYLGADAPYIEEVERLVFMGIVARLLDPGCKFDYMPILQGRQGIGKSTLCRLLALVPGMYAECVSDLNRPREWWYQTGAKSIVELSELAAFKRTQDVERLKSFVTTQYDEWTPLYQKQLVSRPRTFVLVGTTNVDHYLVDPTGNRRFVPIVCGAEQAHPGLFDGRARSDILQAYTEARDLYLAGDYRLTLTAEAEKFVERSRQDALIVDEEAHRIVAFMQAVPVDRIRVQAIALGALGAEDVHGNSFTARKIKDVVSAHCGNEWQWREGVRIDGEPTNGFVRKGSEE